MKRLTCGGLAVLALAFSFSSDAAMKWHPGHYVILDGYSSQTSHFTQINEVANVGGVKGVVLRLWWYELEPSKGSYNLSRIDAYLTKLKSSPTPKRLIVRIMDRKFGSSTWGTRPRGIIPD